MNVARHMEAIVIAAAIVLGASCYATAPAPALQVASSSMHSTASFNVPDAHIVQVKARRLTAAQKAFFA
ncbi:hypothetical protein [Janthinobacterium sp. PC23-8]|uniref:hypothetical protein n=1 Tax=Janthinobacterium sp. PC23-8 TaxID=2012679 RepID=UPI000B9622AF|nr:hypothetical protein [Janthinobacterium sp. PC23-8]OYO30073.1 hypothetical protein CD932_02155 [Janthinobacterium sp. PC23-8]